MAILRCLQRLIKNSNSNSNPLQRLYLTSLSLTKPPPPTSASTTTTAPPFSFLCRHHPLSADVTFPFNGPLFLSSPPWKLSQSATPLLLQSDVVLPRLTGFKLGFPLKLGFRERGDRSKGNESEVVGSRIGDGGLLDSFVNLPKFRLGFLEKVDRSKENELAVGGSRIGDGGFYDSFINLPNFVSFSRMVSGPVLGWMIINEWYLPAFVGLAVSGATDWLDGYLARRMGINSVVGSYLDPLADKVLVGCVAVAMVENNLLHPGIVSLVVLRDVMLVGGAVYKRASSLGWQWKSWYDFFNLDGTRPEKVEPLFISKVNTVFQLLLVAGALLQPELGTSETQPCITYLSWLVASTTVVSTAAYGVQHMRNRSISVARGH